MASAIMSRVSHQRRCFGAQRVASRNHHKCGNNDFSERQLSRCIDHVVEKIHRVYGQCAIKKEI